MLHREPDAIRLFEGRQLRAANDLLDHAALAADAPILGGRGDFEDKRGNSNSAKVALEIVVRIGLIQQRARGRPRRFIIQQFYGRTEIPLLGNVFENRSRKAAGLQFSPANHPILYKSGTVGY